MPVTGGREILTAATIHKLVVFQFETLTLTFEAELS